MEPNSIKTALRHLAAKRFDEAEEILAKVPPESKSYSKAIKLLIRCKVSQSDFPGAEAAARRAVDVGGGNYDVLWNLATAQRHQRKFAEAAASYGRALEVADDVDDRRRCYQMVATCLGFDKDYDRAETVLREALQHFPEAEFYASLARVRLNLADSKEALEAANTALTLDGGNLKAREIVTEIHYSPETAPSPARRARWIPFPGQLSAYEDARRVIKSSLLRGYPTGKPFITKDTEFLTLGSCFASNLAKELQARNMKAFTEFMGESVNSTHANLAFLNWVENGVQDESGELMQAAYGDTIRERYLNAARNCDVFVFTLGMAASFFDKKTGKFFFMSLAGGSEKSIFADHEMRTTTVAENVANLKSIIGTIRRLSRKRVSTVLTVSPVPLAATSEMDSAVIADCLSKSTLRLACEEVRASDTSGSMHYWPSFEIVRWLGPYFPAYHPLVYGTEDRKARHVSRWIVRLIVEMFLETYSREQPAERIEAAMEAVEAQAAAVETGTAA